MWCFATDYAFCNAITERKKRPCITSSMSVTDLPVDAKCTKVRL